MTEIKNIIFDLGGVILNIDYQLTSRAFRGLGISDFDHLYTQKNQADIFNRFETGDISPQEFRDYFNKKMNFKFSNDEIDKAWNAMLLDLPEDRLTFIEKINSTYKIFLLSNTNTIHIKAFKKIIQHSVGIKRFENAFIKCYYSSEIGLRKPNKESFEMIMKKHSLLVNETLFIDDSSQHIESAKQIGLKTYHLINNEDITTIFPDISL